MQLDGKKIKIVGMVFTVQLEDSLISDRNEKLFGITIYDDCLIKIDKGIDYQNQVATLFHEITHIMLNAIGNDEYDYNDENLVNPLGHIMYQVFKENEIDVK